MDFGGFLWIFDLRRFWVPSGSKTALSGVVNPELQFQFQEKGKKEKKPRKIKGLRQKNKNQVEHLVTTSTSIFDVTDTFFTAPQAPPSSKKPLEIN